MKTQKKIPVPKPGDFINELLEDMGISAYRLAIAARLPHSRVHGLLAGTQRVSVTTALKLSRFFETTPGYWINLQRHFDAWTAEDNVDAGLRRELDQIVPASKFVAVAA
jgi:addiction module HigA family antidote